MISVFHIFIYTANILLNALRKKYFNKENDGDVVQNNISEEVRYAGEPASYDEERGLIFEPPVYRQRYLAIQDLFSNVRWRNKIKKIVDFGCAELKLFQFLKRVVGVQEILEVDIDRFILEKNSYRVEPLLCEFLNIRRDSLHVLLLSGSIAQPDARLIGTDMVIGIEIIEHLYPDTLEALPYNIFGFIRPAIAVFTTPNADFNVLFRSTNKFRHDDHKFEWSKIQFRDWAINIIERYPDYQVIFEGIGAPPFGKEDLGCCSQMAIFTLKNHSYRNSCDHFDDYESFGVCTYESYTLNYLKSHEIETDKDDKVDSTTAPENTKYFYRLVKEFHYPYEESKDKYYAKVLMDVQYRLSVIGTEWGPYFDINTNLAKVPVEELLLSLQDTYGFEDVMSTVESHFTIEECAHKGRLVKCILFEITKTREDSESCIASSDCDGDQYNSDESYLADSVVYSSDQWSNHSIAGSRDDPFLEDEGASGDYCRDFNDFDYSPEKSDLTWTNKAEHSSSSDQITNVPSQRLECQLITSRIPEVITDLESIEKKTLGDQKACANLISTQNSSVKLSANIVSNAFGVKNEILSDKIVVECNAELQVNIMSSVNHASVSNTPNDQGVILKRTENTAPQEEPNIGCDETVLTTVSKLSPSQKVSKNCINSSLILSSNCNEDRKSTKTDRNPKVSNAEQGAIGTPIVHDLEKNDVHPSSGSEIISLRSESSIDRSNSIDEQRDLLFDSGYQKSMLEMSPQSPNDLCESDEFDDKSEMARLELKECASAKCEASPSDLPDKLVKKKFELSKPKVSDNKGARKKEILPDKWDKVPSKPCKIIPKLETKVVISDSKNLVSPGVINPVEGEIPIALPVEALEMPLAIVENPEGNLFRPVIVENGDLINNNRDGEGNNYEHIPEPEVLENDNEIMPQLPADNLDIHNENHIVLEENRENVFLVHENADFGDELNDHGAEIIEAVNDINISVPDDVTDETGPSTSSLEVNVSNNDILSAGAQQVGPIQVNIVNMMPPNNDQPEQMVGLIVNGNENGVNLLAEPFPDWLMRLLHGNVDVPEHLDYLSQGDNLTVNPNDDDFDESSSSQESNGDNEADDEQDDAPDIADIESNVGLAIDEINSSNALLLPHHPSEQSLAGVENIENEELFFDSVNDLSLHVPSAVDISPSNPYLDDLDYQEQEPLTFHLAAMEVPVEADATVSLATTNENMTADPREDSDLNTWYR